LYLVKKKSPCSPCLGFCALYPGHRANDRLGWWGKTVFLLRPNSHLLIPFIPWSILPPLQLLSTHLGTNDPIRNLLIVASMIAAGFMEDALFRSVVRSALQRKSQLFAAVTSSLLFSLLHLTGLLVGADPSISPRRSSDHFSWDSPWLPRCW
jgi:membrane protease YdiL (CAAX protease family)